MKLINKKYLAEYGPWPKNYNLDEVIQYEPIAVELWIRPLIGDAMLEELEYQIENDALTDENSTLLTTGNLWRYLCMAIAYEALPIMAYKVTEVGLVKSDSDNSKSVDTKEFATIQQHIRRQLEGLKEIVLKWLCERQDIYQLFDTCQCNCGGCCGDSDGLKKPNANWEIYSTGRKRTDLR